MDRATSGPRPLTRAPLRTYSKRSTVNNSTTLPAKKRPLEGVTSEQPEIESSRKKAKVVEPTAPAQVQSAQQLVPAQAPQPKRGSILNYFKVTSPSSGNASSASACAQSSEPTCSQPHPEPSSSPGSIIEPSRKRPRRLTTKPTRQTQGANTSIDLGDTEHTYSEKINVVLQDISINIVNQDQRDREATAVKSGLAPGATGREGTRKMKRPQRTKAIQTTLSLSLSEKQFTECEECKMLFNPYHDKDVKLHARRHAAMVKKRRVSDRNALLDG
ncbi:hypothetical protein BX600DRAFT_262482 [Xylariales sp. PMI_506]|nr:hypothetical protein BX600DRAFT_262482 [Xylariales sp. PMI_506]